jgi:F-type H+-transporting ATPase subunit a
MPQNSNSNHSAGSFDGVTSRPLQIAQGGEPKQLATGETTAEEKPPVAGTMPSATLLFFNSVLIAVALVVFGLAAKRSLKKIPKGFSNFGEWVAEQLNTFTVGIIGPEGEKYTPLIGTIFLYILGMNLIGLIPTLHSPTTNVTITLALGLCVWIFVQFTGVRNNGGGGYLMHFMGPKLGKYPLAAPLMFPIEIISDVFRPFTLAIRLFGNIFGEDVILSVLAGMGVASVATRWIPIQFPILFLAVLTSVVQALVFALLACIYISLVSHHEEDHEPHVDGHHAEMPHDAAPQASHSS